MAITQRFFSTLCRKSRVVLLMGGPGSGKSAAAKSLADICGWVSMGERLREITKDKHHPCAPEINAKMKKGQLVSDELIFKVLNTQSELNQSDKLCFLDGCPRTLEQWQLFQDNYGMPIAVVNLSVKADTMEQRLTGRGRDDDLDDIIETRITEFFETTYSMAQKIIAEIPLSLIIEADNLTSAEAALQIRDFLEQNRLIPAIDIERSSDRLCQS